MPMAMPGSLADCRSPTAGTRLAVHLPHGANAMQASLPVTPQTPAATPTVMPGQAPAVGGSRVVPAAPQFDAAIVKAMANTAVKATTATATADQPAVPAAQPVANQPTVLPPAPATPTPAVPQALPLPQVLQLSQALPLPLPDPSVVTGPV